VIENGAERIMQMAERNQQHRIYCERKDVDTDARLSAIGQVGGFILTIAGTYIAAIGQTWVAGAIFTTTILGIATTFVLRQKPNSRPPD
jgi:uncharacterized membrane protein